MPRLQIRDVKDSLDETNSNLNKLKNAVYILAVVQIGLVAHTIFSILAR